MIDNNINMKKLVNDFMSIVSGNPNNPLVPKLNVMINNILYYCEKARLDLLSAPPKINNAINNLNSAIISRFFTLYCKIPSYDQVKKSLNNETK